MIIINGEQLFENEILLTEYLVDKNYNIERIAVELNGEILPKAKYSQAVLKDGDKLEIVSFVGGG